MTTNTIQDFIGADIIDVRDIIARVEELREEREALEAHAQECDDNHAEFAFKDAQKALTSWKEGEEGVELSTLESLLENLCGNGGDEQWEGDWYPVTLIVESYFEQSMDEMLKDCGYIPKDLPPFLTITVDYDALKQDYQECEFEGRTYYFR